MSVVSHINRKSARTQPEESFASPHQLAVEMTMTRGEKIASLEEWRFEVQSRLDSAAEGMAPMAEASGKINDGSSPLDRDAELLREIDLELDALKAKPRIET